jgi:hypothetical protein
MQAECLNQQVLAQYNVACMCATLSPEISQKIASFSMIIHFHYEIGSNKASTFCIEKITRLLEQDGTHIPSPFAHLGWLASTDESCQSCSPPVPDSQMTLLLH